MSNGHTSRNADRVDKNASGAINHDSAIGHVSGQSIYIDDMPRQHNELLVDYFGSPLPRGRIKSLDLEAARAVSGVVALFTYKDLHHNKFGPILQDEVLLVEDIAEFIGQPIVVIAAENHAAIKACKAAIKLEMEALDPLLNIDDAIKAGAYIDREYMIERGDVEAAMAECSHVIEGRLYMAGADHFYLESQACLVYPGEYGQLVVHSSTQAPSEVQHVVAHLLGLSISQVVCIVKRMGGGFGGKECQATHPAVMAALVALRTGRPARLVMNKDDDMMYTGKRHPFQNDYKVGFDDSGRVQALSARLYADGGAYNDLSTAVLGRALTHIDNAYFLPNVKVLGRIAKTNFPPNTAFRGFGGPQGVLTIECIMEEIAAYLKKDPFSVRRANCYGIEERNTTHYGQLLEKNTLPELFDKLRLSADYDKRMAAVKSFNESSQTHLKGLSLTAVKFGISFTNKFLNQANALVNVYLDGSIQVSTGATEMGQGVNTNIKIIVADEFAIDPHQVIVMATSTEKNNNTSATAASSATDLNGSAAQIACRAIKGRLQKVAADYFATQETGVGAYPERIVFAGGEVFDERKPHRRLTFKEIVNMAYRERVSLGERGHYATPSISFDWSVGKGTPFLYYTNGVAVSEVCIDRFTGALKVERVDILMDIGKSINEGLNRGQIAGAFAQGLGWLTMEDLRYAPNGALLSHSPTTYKIPGIYDLPSDFKIDLLENENTVNVRGSKAVGEPPLLLGISVWTAVKHALSFVSGDAIPVLNTPASGEEILERLTAYCQSPASDAKQRSRWGGDGSILLRGQSFAHGESRTSPVRAASVAAKKQ
ncbi:MAG: xanthine dehydrogenase molybdopterin binding subunit [Candidatus Melainabacteria bacterium]|nr:xanthine dehydrogenase molybdopterin binding subunit [Candidatus Melainabacteria bacterium]